jgi:hypothetical protein
VLSEGKVGEDLTEIARLFNVHNQKIDTSKEQKN